MVETRKVTEADVRRAVVEMWDEFLNPRDTERYVYLHPEDYKKLKQLIEPKEEDHG